MCKKNQGQNISHNLFLIVAFILSLTKTAIHLAGGNSMVVTVIDTLNLDIDGLLVLLIIIILVMGGDNDN